MSSLEGSFVFGVDLDGVVAHFYRGLKPIAAEWVGRPVKELPDDYASINPYMRCSQVSTR